MNVRLDIINQCKADLALITVANGYTNEFKVIGKTLIPLYSSFNLPAAFCYLLDGAVISKYNNNSGFYEEGELHIIVQGKAVNASGKITDMAETFIQDIRDWVMRKKGSAKSLFSSIAPDASVNPVPSVLAGLVNVEAYSWYISKYSPYFDFNTGVNLFEIDFTIKLNYELN